MLFQRAVIHIGVHKTGTKTLQHVLHGHQQLLSEGFDVCYPGTLLNQGWLYSNFCDAPHRHLLNIRAGACTLEAARELNEVRLQEFQGILEAAPESTLLLSGEDLSFLPHDGVKAFQDWMEAVAEHVTIIMWLREPVAWATSRTVQALRQQLTLEQAYEKCLSFKGLRNRLEPWLETFGRSAMAVRDFDVAKGHPHGIVGAFCEMAGIPQSFMQGVDHSVRRNVSMGDLGARLLSELNRSRPLFVDGKLNAERSQGDHKPFEKIRGRPFRLPCEVIERVVEESRPECEWLAESFGVRFTPAVPEQTTAEDALSGRHTLESLALTIADLYRDARKTRG